MAGAHALELLSAAFPGVLGSRGIYGMDSTWCPCGMPVEQPTVPQRQALCWSLDMNYDQQEVFQHCLLLGDKNKWQSDI